jgi:hypothetical protein
MGGWVTKRAEATLNFIQSALSSSGAAYAQAMKTDWLLWTGLLVGTIVTISFFVYGMQHQDLWPVLVALGSVAFTSLGWYRRRHRS